MRKQAGFKEPSMYKIRLQSRILSHNVPALKRQAIMLLGKPIVTRVPHPKSSSVTALCSHTLHDVLLPLPCVQWQGPFAAPIILQACAALGCCGLTQSGCQWGGVQVGLDDLAQPHACFPWQDGQTAHLQHRDHLGRRQRLARAAPPDSVS